MRHPKITFDLVVAVGSSFVKVPQLQQAYARGAKTIVIESLKVKRAELEARFDHVLPLQNHKGLYDIFISHRHGDADSAAVARFTNALVGEVGEDRGHLRLFFDSVSLTKGRRFDLDFMTALSHTLVCVPFVSLDALARMREEKELQRPDNVLLEWSLALFLQEQGVLAHIVPVFIGPTHETTSGGTVMEDLFACVNPETDFPDAVNEPTYAHLADFVRKEFANAEPPPRRTVWEIVRAIMACNSDCLCWKMLNVESMKRVTIRALANEYSDSGRLYARCASKVAQIRQDAALQAETWKAAMNKMLQTRKSSSQKEFDSKLLTALAAEMTSAPASRAETWSVSNVLDWLKTIGIPEFCTQFAREEVNGRELLDLSDADLAFFGVKGKHLKLFKAERKKLL
eukprot:m.268790 g.268790  ORF g.268790 m.268790 type:complete len:400 (-) comp22814_c0_seq8:8-1207(-)